MRLANAVYAKIKKIIAEMYEDLAYTHISIDVFELAERLDIKLIPYSKLSEDEYSTISAASNDGFTYLRLPDWRYEIYYNDEQNERRINFTIMHEIGHIMLEHIKPEGTVHSPEHEAEANFFAKSALVPEGLIAYFGIGSVYELVNTFAVSFECAEYIAASYNASMQYPNARMGIAQDPIAKHFINTMVEEAVL